jgi:hypothetical protein
MDVASLIARSWLDQNGVTAIVDMPNDAAVEVLNAARVGRKRLTPIFSTKLVPGRVYRLQAIAEAKQRR